MVGVIDLYVKVYETADMTPYKNSKQSHTVRIVCRDGLNKDRYIVAETSCQPYIMERLILASAERNEGSIIKLSGHTYLRFDGDEPEDKRTYRINLTKFYTKN
jgi:hypothetical protein